jgi:regulatory protein
VRGKPKPKGPLEPRELEEAALRYLDRFDCSAKKLGTYLGTLIRRRGGDAPALLAHVDTLLERYRASGLINDERFARNLSAQLVTRGKSRRAIVQKLRMRGIASSVVDDVVSKSSETELEAARALVKRRRLGPFRPEGERLENRRKDLAALARAGFDHDTAVRALGYGNDDDF